MPKENESKRQNDVTWARNYIKGFCVILLLNWLVQG